MISWPSKSTLQRLLDLTDRFALHNIRKIRPFLTEHAAQLLVQALVISRLDYCNALLAGLPSNTIKPLQMIQNAAARLVFNEPKRAHVTPLFISLALAPGCSSHPVQVREFFKKETKAWNTLCDFCPDFTLILQSEQVDASWGKSEPVSWQIPQKISKCIMSQTPIIRFRLWFYPVGGYQTCLIFSVDFRTHVVRFHLSCVS